MQRKLKLLIAYDGTDFHGWQRQPGLRTVQQELEQVARRVLGHPLEIVGASRTDAGVHARGQVAHLVTSCTIPAANLQRAIDQRLPDDLALLHVCQQPAEFHASRDARAKLYRYRIYQARQRPAAELLARFTWHVWHELDEQRLRAAAAAMVGRHDFAGFAGRGSPRQHTVRTVHRIGIRRRCNELQIDVQGDGFLYNQVRNMVGTLVEIGRGHWSPQRVAEILASRDRRRAGPTAPARGLCLQWVSYARPGERSHGT